MSIDTTAPDSVMSSVASNGDHFGGDASTPSTITVPNTASAEFVRAVSDFLDTDPTDLLNELGYYDRDENR